MNQHETAMTPPMTAAAGMPSERWRRLVRRLVRWRVESRRRQAELDRMFEEERMRIERQRAWMRRW